MIFLLLFKILRPQSDLKIVLNRTAYYAIIDCDALGIEYEHIQTESID